MTLADDLLRGVLKMLNREMTHILNFFILIKCKLYRTAKCSQNMKDRQLLYVQIKDKTTNKTIDLHDTYFQLQFSEYFVIWVIII